MLISFELFRFDLFELFFELGRTTSLNGSLALFEFFFGRFDVFIVVVVAVVVEGGGEEIWGLCIIAC